MKNNFNLDIFFKELNNNISNASTSIEDIIKKANRNNSFIWKDEELSFDTTFQDIEENFSIWLKCNLKTLSYRCNNTNKRPLLQNKNVRNEIGKLDRIRKKNYIKSDLIIDTSRKTKSLIIEPSGEYLISSNKFLPNPDRLIVFKNCLGIIMSVSIFNISNGAAIPFRVLNFSIFLSWFQTKNKNNQSN